MNKNGHFSANGTSLYSSRQKGNQPFSNSHFPHSTQEHSILEILDRTFTPLYQLITRQPVTFDPGSIDPSTRIRPDSFDLSSHYDYRKVRLHIYISHWLLGHDPVLGLSLAHIVLLLFSVMALCQFDLANHPYKIRHFDPCLLEGTEYVYF